KSQPDQFHFEFRGIVFPGKSFFSAHEVSTCKISGCLSYRILDSGPDGTQTTLTDMHWNYRLLSDREWSGRNAVALSAGVNGIYLSRANLDVAFDDSGRQINPLTARLTGNVVGVMKVFNRCGWQAEPESGASLPHQYSLMAGQGVPGKGD
ncbi:hypothetical protein QWI30_02690, partial [Citrobacter freundii]|nr:hypothetical protein [Citrobacter freundii]